MGSVAMGACYTNKDKNDKEKVSTGDPKSVDDGGEPIPKKRSGSSFQEPEMKRQRHNSHCTDFEFTEAQLIKLLQAFEDMALNPPQKIPLLQHRRSRANYPTKPPCLDFSFERLADSDGYLDVNEMKNFLSMEDIEAEELFERFDTDHDGRIDAAEFDDAAQSPALVRKRWVKMYDLSKKWTDEYCEKILSNHKPAPEDRRPIMFYSYGAQGSGKTTTTNFYLESIDAHPVEINIDYITKSYAESVLEDATIIKDDEKYWQVRNGWPRAIRMELLRKCQDGRYDMLWETTGSHETLWTEIGQPLVKCDSHYKLVLMYNLVPFSEIAQRLLHRYRETGQAFASIARILEQVKKAAFNTKIWFDSPDDGVFIYFDNNFGPGEQKQIKSEKELKQMLQRYPFVKYVREHVQWRGPVSEQALDLKALANEAIVDIKSAV